MTTVSQQPPPDGVPASRNPFVDLAGLVIDAAPRMAGWAAEAEALTTTTAAFSFTADEAEELGLDTDDDNTAAPVVDELASVAAEVKEFAALTADELYREVFVAPNLDLLLNVADMARGWQLGSPWGVLLTAVGVSACDTPATSFYAGMGSTRVPLNFLLGFVGISGLGKGLCLSAPIYPESTRRVSGVMGGMNPDGAEIVKVSAASGEALVDKFFEDKEDPADPKKKTHERHYRPVWADWREVDNLAAKAKGQSSTLEGVVRSLFTGEPVGDESISRAKSGVGMTLEPMSYRFVASMGVQPKRAAAFYVSDGGGTIQRLLNAEITDTEAPDERERYRLRCQLHRRMGLPLPVGMGTMPPPLYVHGPVNVTVSDDVIRAVAAFRRAVLTGAGIIAEEDTHSVNTRLRLAALYAGWRKPPGSPVVIDMVAWRWAGLVLEHSRRCLAGVLGVLRKGKEAEAVERGVLMGVSKEAADGHLEESRTLQVRALSLILAEKVARNPGITRRILQGNSSPKQRALFADALDTAEDDGRIYQDATGGYYIAETED